MKRKMFGTLLASLFMLSACGASSSAHTHTYSSSWSSNSTSHWHQATCGHDLRSGESFHTFRTGVVTKEATASEFGIMTYTCATCGYSRKEPIDKVATQHTHTYSSSWSSNSTSHWHQATCGHDLRSGESFHTFRTGVVTKEATASEFGIMTYTCTACGYSKNEPIDKVAISKPKVVANFPTETVYVAIGETKSIDYSVTLDGESANPMFESVSETIAYASDAGVVGLAKGTTVIKALYDGEIIGSFTVRVFRPLESVALATATSTSLYAGDKRHMKISDKGYWAPAGSYVSGVHLAQYYPADADFNLYDIAFSSSDEGVLAFTDSTQGDFSCLSEGSAKISCSLSFEQCEINLVAMTVTVQSVNYPTGIKLSYSSLSMKLPANSGTYETYLYAYLLGDNVNKYNVTWESSDPNIVKIGTQYDFSEYSYVSIVGLNPGDAVLTAKTENGFTATCAVTVRSDAPYIVDSNGYSPSTTWGGFPMGLGKTMQLKNSNGGKVTWSSSDETVATVDSNGLVSGLSTGETTITAVDSYGKSSKRTIRVYDVTVAYPTASFNVDNYYLINGTTAGSAYQSATCTVLSCAFDGTDGIAVSLKLAKTSGAYGQFKINAFLYDSDGALLKKVTLTSSSLATGGETTLGCHFSLALDDEYISSYSVSFSGVAW